MQVFRIFLWLILSSLAIATTALPQTNSAAPAIATAPPSAPAERSETDLDKLVAPIALYPDPLLATLLPASAYPVEIVQAARFVKDTNNIAKLDSQPWDDNVKALARFPDVIAKMDADIGWTSDLGQAFVENQKSVMDAIQKLRGRAQQAGALKTTPQQNVVTTNEVVQKTVEQQVIYVTNTVVQIQPAQPQVIYVPQYNPAYLYAPPPAYVYNPVAPLVTFGVGMAVGAAIANNCDWHGGGVYVGPRGGVAWGGGHYHGDVDVDVNRNVNVNQTVNRNVNANRSANSQKWQPDPNRRTSASSAYTPQARGWSGQSSQNISQARSQASQNASAARSQASQRASAARAQGGSGVPSGTSSARGAGGSSAFSSSGGASQARMASARGSASRSGAFRGGGGRRR